MALRFVGIDPNTGSGQSPTVWVDEDSGELVIQGWKVTAETFAECGATSVPGHAIGIPDSETVIRVPSRMAAILREACSVVESA